jgi:hypothetical protein
MKNRFGYHYHLGWKMKTIIRFMTRLFFKSSLFEMLNLCLLRIYFFDFYVAQTTISYHFVLEFLRSRGLSYWLVLWPHHLLVNQMRNSSKSHTWKELTLSWVRCICCSHRFCFAVGSALNYFSHFTWLVSLHQIVVLLTLWIWVWGSTTGRWTWRVSSWLRLDLQSLSW